MSRDFDNIVELELGAPWPLPPAQATATLAHKFELVGQFLGELYTSPFIFSIAFPSNWASTTGFSNQFCQPWCELEVD